MKKKNTNRWKTITKLEMQCFRKRFPNITGHTQTGSPPLYISLSRVFGREQNLCLQQNSPDHNTTSTKFLSQCDAIFSNPDCSWTHRTKDATL